MNSHNPFAPQWQQPLLDMQRQYWDAWTDLSRRSMGLAEPPKPAWENAIDHWWQAAGNALPDETRPLFGQFVEQGKQLFKLQQEFAAQLQQGDWQQAALATIERVSEQFSRAGKEGSESWAAAAARPWEAWQSWAAQLPPQLPNWLQPEALAKLMSQGGDLGQWQQQWQQLLAGGSQSAPFAPQLDQLLNAPGVGYFREHEANYKRYLGSLMALRSALTDYSAHFADLNQEALNRLRDELTADNATPVTGARDLYNRWVNICEEIYAERVSGADYQALNGRLINSQMACRRDAQQLMRPWLQQLGIPDAADLRSLQQRLQEMRRRERQQQRDMNAMMARIEALEAAASSAASSAAGSAPASAAASTPASSASASSASASSASASSAASNSASASSAPASSAPASSASASSASASRASSTTKSRSSSTKRSSSSSRSSRSEG